MTQSNLSRSQLKSLVGRFFEVFSRVLQDQRVDAEGRLACFAPSFDYKIYAPGTTLRLETQDELRSLYLSMPAYITVDYRIEAIHIDEHTNTAIAEGEGHRVLLSGAPFDYSFTFIMTFADEVIVRWREFVLGEQVGASARDAGRRMSELNCGLANLGDNETKEQ